MERKANTKKYRSPIVLYPIYWGIQDTRTSPGIYRALGAGVALNGKTEKPKHTRYSSLQANIGLGKPNFEDGAIQYNLQFAYDISYLWPLVNDLEVGFNGFAFQHSRIAPTLSNSSFASDVAVGIGPSANFSKNVTLFKKDTKLTASLSLPLISYVNRVPEFGLSFTGTNSFVAPIGRFNKISFKLNAERLFKKSAENKINYFYKWDYYGMEEFDGLHNLRIASHQIGFHLWIKRN